MVLVMGEEPGVHKEKTEPFLILVGGGCKAICLSSSVQQEWVLRGAWHCCGYWVGLERACMIFQQGKVPAFSLCSFSGWLHPEPALTRSFYFLPPSNQCRGRHRGLLALSLRGSGSLRSAADLSPEEVSFLLKPPLYLQQRDSENDVSLAQ